LAYVINSSEDIFKMRLSRRGYNVEECTRLRQEKKKDVLVLPKRGFYRKGAKSVTGGRGSETC